MSCCDCRYYLLGTYNKTNMRFIQHCEEVTIWCNYNFLIHSISSTFSTLLQFSSATKNEASRRLEVKVAWIMPNNHKWTQNKIISTVSITSNSCIPYKMSFMIPLKRMKEPMHSSPNFPVKHNKCCVLQNTNIPLLKICLAMYLCSICYIHDCTINHKNYCW